MIGLLQTLGGLSSRASWDSRSRAIGPAGTAARALVGLGLLAVAAFAWGVSWWEVPLGLVAFPAVVLTWQALRAQRTVERLSAIGAGAHLVNIAVAVALFAIPATRGAALLFYGGSMLVAAVRGYAGCEVTAVSNWILRRDDQVGCVVFAPVDAAEARLEAGR